ncbi:MAG: carboxynorspermidine decarboxylase [Bacteroidota bacterium]
MSDDPRIPSPCYVLEEVRLRDNLSVLSRVEAEAGVQIILAFKAFATWAVFPIVREYLSGATASSLYEAKLCVEHMGQLAHTYSPAYLPEDFGAILDRSSHLTFNSIGQYQQYRAQVAAHPNVISCGLRINPEYVEVETELYNPCAPGSRLGVVASQLETGLPIGIEGLHFHNLCESNSYALEATLQSVEKHFGHLLPQVKWINMGGGHLITGKDYDVDHLITLLKRFKARHDVHIILEPGSAIAWQVGFLKTRVLDIVENNEIKTAIIDASFTAHMPDTLEMPYRPIIRGAVAASSDAWAYRIGGVSCLAGDYLAEYHFASPLKVGQVLLFEDMIHYTMVKTTMFNGVKHPSIALWTAQGTPQILRAFTYADFKSRLS